MMSVHDALLAWQEARITARQAMKLTGTTDVVALYGLAQECDVAIRMELTQSEARKVALVSDAIIRAFANDGHAGGDTP